MKPFFYRVYNDINLQIVTKIEEAIKPLHLQNYNNRKKVLL